VKKRAKKASAGVLPQVPLFDELKPEVPEPLIKPFPYPIWTENKARLIERYLYYFVLLTKHGTYIDGFAGPQDPEKSETWAARLVLETQPRWLRHFHLFELSAAKVAQLNALKAAQPPQKPGEPKREIRIRQGDFNELLPGLLASGEIGQKEATFCLLDQHTFECEWRTVEALAHYKSGRKIELFYFLPIAWLDRALSATKDEKRLEAWWGRDDWTELRRMDRERRKLAFDERFKKELHYASVKAWPVREREGGTGRIMYYMVHATDHLVAPLLMERAYQNAVAPLETEEQFLFQFMGGPPKDPME